MADRHAARREHLPHVPHRHPDAPQGRPGRARQVRLPLQAHDHGRRADRAQVWRWYYENVGKDEAVIVDTWWQTETGGFLGSTLPGIDPMKPGSCGPAALGIYPVILDEDGNEVPGGQRQGRQHLHPQPVAGRLPDDLGPAGPVRLDLLRQVQQGPEVHRLARLAVLRRRRRGPGGRRLLPHPRARRRRDQRGRPPARHQGARVGRAHRQRGRRGRRGPGRRRHPRPGRSRCTSRSSPATTPARRSRRRSRPRSRPTSARSPGRGTSGSSPTCRRRGPARSCAG